MIGDKFFKDKSKGSKGERLACRILKNDLGELQIMSGNFPDYDLLGQNLWGEKITLEVKTDITSFRTGNVAIEYAKKDHVPSGISTSKADYYFIIGYDKDYSEVVDGIKHNGWWLGFLIDTDILRGLALADYVRETRGGDRMSVLMKLLPIKELYENCMEFYPIKSKELSLYH